MNAPAILLTIAQVDVVWDGSQGQFLSCMMVDDDGSGDPHNDPDFQARTSYRNPDPETGVPRWLNADVVPYIVLPPQILTAVPQVVLGCQAFVHNAVTNLFSPAVVGDIGPHSKIGEGSIALAKALGVPSSPTTGGESRKVLRYTFFPGRPAVVNGVTYALQAYSPAGSG